MQTCAQRAYIQLPAMKTRAMTLPELFLIAGTRVALGIGVGLLLSERLSDDQRKGAGVALLAVGALTTIPIITGLLGKEPVSERVAA